MCYIKVTHSQCYLCWFLGWEDTTVFLACLKFTSKEEFENCRRIQALTACAKKYGKEALRTAVINAATAPFLNGASEKPFVANFDWIFRPNNFPIVLEGNYNHEVSNFNPSNYGTSQKLTAQQRIEKSLKQGTEHFAEMLARNEASLHEDVPAKVW